MSPPIPASTVLLIRPESNSVAEDFSIFFVRRTAKSTFMPNAYVFPGGKVDGEDSNPSLLPFVTGMTPEQAAENLEDVPPEVAIGYYVAALRETFEEAGVLFATRANGDPLSLELEEDQDRFDGYRKTLHDGSLSLQKLAQDEGILFSLNPLVYWDHWVTPEVEDRRYSARFFMGRMPEGFSPVHDSYETTDSGWYSPSDILQRHQADRLTLAPPTLRILIELQELGSMKAVEEESKSRKVLVPNLPVAHLEGENFVLLLPGDRDYPGSTSIGLHRAQMKKGRWTLIRE